MEHVMNWYEVSLLGRNITVLHKITENLVEPIEEVGIELHADASKSIYVSRHKM
jgi:hypothetical protein